MVDALGRVAMALLSATPASADDDTRGVIAFVAVTSMLPDIDSLLSTVASPVFSSPDIGHTVLFVDLAIAGTGVLSARGLGDRLADWTGTGWLQRPVPATGALLPGGLSHLLTDSLPATDLAPSVESFGPFVARPGAIGGLRNDAAQVNAGLSAVGSSVGGRTDRDA